MKIEQWDYKLFLMNNLSPANKWQWFECVYDVCKWRCLSTPLAVTSITDVIDWSDFYKKCADGKYKVANLVLNKKMNAYIYLSINLLRFVIYIMFIFIHILIY